MQAKKGICHNTISTFYPLTPMSHFSLFAYWDNAHKTNILKFCFQLFRKLLPPISLLSMNNS